MRKAKLIVGFFLVTTLVGCDNRKDYFKGTNKAPEITVRGMNPWNDTQNGIFEKEIFDSLKLKKGKRYQMEANLGNDGDSVELAIEVAGTSMPGEIYLDGEIFEEGEKLLEKSIQEFSYSPDVIGEHRIYAAVRDEYNEEDRTPINIHVFKNLEPVPALEIVHEGEYDPKEYKFSALDAYDKDEKFGGGLVQYHFEVDQSYEVKIEEPTMKHIFQNTGNHQVKVRVMDSDSVWSGWVSKNVNV